MVKTKSKYDFEGNEKLCNYARLYYRNQLSNGAMQVYLLGMPYLERRKSGFCQPVIANYEQIGAATCKDYSGLKKPLLELQNVLCDIKFGQRINGKTQATVFRRYTLNELKEKKLKAKIINTSPTHAKELSEILSKRSFVYGKNTDCKPFWNIAKTGRILSRKPNVQGDRKEDRVENLRLGLKGEEVLFDLDIKQAEPSIIQQLIEYKFDFDPYEKLAEINKIKRAEAKPKINMLAYSADSLKIIRHWSLDTQKIFMPYATKLEEYKTKLWKKGKPQNGQRRFADTLGNSRIHANRGERTHKGKILNWHIQGTVADIINTACLEIIEKEKDMDWKLLFPVHDSMYIIGKNQQLTELKQILEKKTESIGLKLSVEIKSYVVGKTQ